MSKLNVNAIPFNLTSIFVLPLLNLNNQWLFKRTKNRRRLVNCFISTELPDEEFQKEDRLYMVLQSFDYDKDFQKEINKIMESDFCTGVFELDFEYTIVVFDMSSFEDYYRFIKGQYSQYSNKGQKNCMEAPYGNVFFESEGKKSVIPISQHIFNKEPARKRYISDLFGVPVSELTDCELAPIYDSVTGEEGTNIFNHYMFNLLNINLTTNNTI